MLATIFVDSNGAMVANRQNYLNRRAGIEPGAATLELYIDKDYLIVGKRAATTRARVYTETTILEECDIGEVSSTLSIYSVRLKRLHLHTTTAEWSSRIYELNNDISTFRAFIKECFHRYNVLILPHCYKNRAERRATRIKNRLSRRDNLLS